MFDVESVLDGYCMHDIKIYWSQFGSIIFDDSSTTVMNVCFKIEEFFLSKESQLGPLLRTELLSLRDEAV